MQSLLRSLAVLSLAAFCGCAPKGEDEPAWVGCVAAFSGPDKAAGARLKQGVGLAVDDAVNQHVEGRRLAVVIADDRGADDSVQAEAVRLLSVNHVAALIGGADPGRALLLARAAQPYAAPTVLPSEWAGPPPGDAVFSLGVRPGWRGEVLARYASGELKLKHVAVLTDGRDPVAVELAAAFVKAWPRDESASVGQETFRSDAELQEQAARVGGTKPDAVLIAADAVDFLKVRNILEAAGLHVPALYGGADAGGERLAAGKDDVITATVFAPEELKERGRAFLQRYEEHFHEPPDLTAVQGYDAARVLLNALSRANSTAGGKVRDQIASSTDFESLTGPLRFQDGRARRRVFVTRVNGGQAAVVQRVEPETDPAR